MDQIEINGVWRPARNSMDRLIHPTEDGIRNFWRWFGDSRAVDEQGRPLVAYHGTNSDFTAFDAARCGSATRAKSAFHGFFFTSSPGDAEGFARHARYQSGRVSESGERILPVYLRLSHPLIVDQGVDDSESMAEMAARAIAERCDGLICRNTSDRVEPPVLRAKGQALDVDHRGMFMADVWPDFQDGGLSAAEVMKHLEETVAFVRDEELPFAGNEDDRAYYQKEMAMWASVLEAFREDPANIVIDYGPPVSVFMAIRSQQIKSAIGNSGVFHSRRSDFTDGAGSSLRTRAAFLAEAAPNDIERVLQVSSATGPAPTGLKP